MSDECCNHDEGNRDSHQLDAFEMKGDGGITSLGEIFDCLTSPKRRFILYYLQENEIADIDELATQIAMREAEAPPDEVSADHRERIVTQLIHTHLPKLVEAQCIEYDRRSSTVRYTSPPTPLDKVLRLLSQLEE